MRAYRGPYSVSKAALEALELVLRAWDLGAGDIPPGIVPYLQHPVVLDTTKLRAAGWTVSFTTPLAITVLPLIVLWTAAWFTFHLGHAWASLLIAIPAAGFLVRLFMIQHDCGHGTFFAGRSANDWVGRVIGVLTLTPYDCWRRSHAIHHATTGNLDRRGTGDLDTLTVREYRALSRWGRLKYRLYRHPLIMFGVGPAYLFLLQQRMPPAALMRKGWQPWASTMATNAAIAALASGDAAIDWPGGETAADVAARVESAWDALREADAGDPEQAISHLLAAGDDAYVFFRHDELGRGPELAASLADAVARRR